MNADISTWTDKKKRSSAWNKVCVQDFRTSTLTDCPKKIWTLALQKCWSVSMLIRRIAGVFLHSMWSKQWMVRLFNRFLRLWPYRGLFWALQPFWSIVQLCPKLGLEFHMDLSQSCPKKHILIINSVAFFYVFQLWSFLAIWAFGKGLLQAQGAWF